MTICRFFQQGNCRYGANCRFEHPGANRQNSNPFSALSGGNTNNRGPFSKQGSEGYPFNLNKDTIFKDLTEERPSWVLSAYGPGRDAPEQLWGGYPIEQSFEEARLFFMLGQMSGNPQQALNEIQKLEAGVQEKMQAAVGNLDGAVNFIIQAQNNHPNRQDICQSNTIPSTGEFAVGKRPVGLPTVGANNSPFGQPATKQANPFSGGGSSSFGQPSGLGQPSAFGQPSALGGGSGFGQPSALGGSTGFGQTSALGQKPSPFGQPSALGGGSGFGQPSALGGSTGFGQTSALGQKPNPFGMGQASQPASGFGQPSQPGQSTGFGQTSVLGAKPNPFSSAGSAPSASPFGGFASNNNSAAAASPFTALGGNTNNASPFAQNGQQPTPSPFGQPQQSTSNEISMDSAPASATNSFANAGNAPSNPFGQPAQSAGNPFAQASSTTNNPFGAPLQQPQPGAQSAPSGAANPYAPNSSRQHPDYDSYATKAPTGQLLRWMGKPVTYKEIEGDPVPGIQNFDGTWTKIWFPNGPPPYYKDTEPDRPYTDEEQAIYNNFINTGKFQLAATGGGGMPQAPPLREICTWNI